MSTITTAANDVLADAALRVAQRASAGSAERKAAGCAAVTLRTTTTIARAKAELEYLGQLGRADIQAAAEACISQLAMRLAQDVPAAGGAEMEGTTT